MQDLIIISLAVLAAFFIGRRIVKSFASQGCEGCDSCGAKKEKSFL